MSKGLLGVLLGFEGSSVRLLTHKLGSKEEQWMLGLDLKFNVNATQRKAEIT